MTAADSASDETALSLQFGGVLAGIIGGYMLAQDGTAAVMIGILGIFVAGLLNGFAAPTEVRELVRL